MMHAEAKHPNCAYMWLEHSISPKLQGDLAAWFGSVPSVPAACKGNALLKDDGCARQGYNAFEKIPLLAHAGVAVQVAVGRLRAVPPLGHGLHRDPRRPVTHLAAARPDLAPAMLAAASRRPAADMSLRRSFAVAVPPVRLRVSAQPRAARAAICVTGGARRRLAPP
jgi:hypothetical protein